MKCYTCGLQTFYYAGTEENDYTIIRHYKCNLGHVTMTLEVLPTSVDRTCAAGAMRDAVHRAWTFMRNQSLLRDLPVMRLRDLAVKYHMTEARARQIRDTEPLVEGTYENLLSTCARGCTEYPASPPARGVRGPRQKPSSAHAEPGASVPARD